MYMRTHIQYIENTIKNYFFNKYKKNYHIFSYLF